MVPKAVPERVKEIEEALASVVSLTVPTLNNLLAT